MRLPLARVGPARSCSPAPIMSDCPSLYHARRAYHARLSVALSWIDYHARLSVARLAPARPACTFFDARHAATRAQRGARGRLVYETICWLRWEWGSSGAFMKRVTVGVCRARCLKLKRDMPPSGFPTAPLRRVRAPSPLFGSAASTGIRCVHWKVWLGEDRHLTISFIRCGNSKTDSNLSS